jgi:hypothetical protein
VITTFVFEYTCAGTVVLRCCQGNGCVSCLTQSWPPEDLPGGIFMAEPEPDDDRSIFDVCMDLEEAAEEDAGDSADDSTRDTLLGLLWEVAALLKRTEDEEDREMFVGEDGVQRTIAAVGRHGENSEVVRAGWTVLQWTCLHQPSHRRLVADEGGLELLARSFGSFVDVAGDVTMLRVLLSAANQLCTKDERNKIMLNGLGVTTSILAALESFASDDAVVAALLETLTWMLRDDDESVEESHRGDMVGGLWEQDILNILIEIVEAERVEPVLDATLRVLQMVCASDKGAEEAVDNGLVDMLVGFLRDRKDQHSVMCTSARFLKDLCQHNEAAKESLLSESADETLLGLLRTYSAHGNVLESAMGLLLGIMFRDEGTGAKMVTGGLIPAIVTGLDANPADKLLYRSSCMMLRELCRIEDNQRIMKEEGIEKPVLAGMRRFAETKAERSIPFQEYGRDVLRDCHSEHYVLGTHSMGVSLLDLDKGNVGTNSSGLTGGGL